MNHMEFDKKSNQPRKVAQCKIPVSAQSSKRPTAPPVYRPQSASNVLLRKVAMAPAAYQPNPLPRVLQLKGAQAAGATARSVTPAVRRSQVGVLQRNSRIVQRAKAGAAPPAAGPPPPVVGGGGGGGGGGAAGGPPVPPVPAVPAVPAAAPAAAAAAAAPARPAMAIEYSAHWAHTRDRRPEWTADVEANDNAVARRIYDDGWLNNRLDDTRYAVNYLYHGQYFIVVAFFRRDGTIRFHTVFISAAAQGPYGGGVTLRPAAWP